MPLKTCKRYCLVTLIMFSMLAVFQSLSEAAGPEPIKLWPDGAPGQKGEEPRDIPLVRVYLPETEATGTAVVILPGGGYGGLAMDHEGHQIAKWWNRQGVAGFVVTYRHGPHYQHPAPLQDAQRAIRYVRANAKDLGVDPERVGVMGFSAGGHLASTVSTHFDDGDKESKDDVARQSSRPDFAVLCYPVISMSEPLGHRGSRRNLLGENPDEELVKNLSNHLQVTNNTPPTFIFHTAEDKVVPVGNAIVYYEALVKHGVSSELHVYQKGRHGVGLAPNDPILSSWPDRLLDWVRTNNFLTSQKRVSLSGNVLLEGAPLSWGMISLHSKQSSAYPSIATMVSRGKYAFAEADGPVPGTYSVSVHNMGTFAPTPSIEDAVTLTGNHDRTNLVVEIIPEAKSQFDFDLSVK